MLAGLRLSLVVRAHGRCWLSLATDSLANGESLEADLMPAIRWGLRAVGCSEAGAWMPKLRWLLKHSRLINTDEAALCQRRDLVL